VSVWCFLDPKHTGGKKKAEKERGKKKNDGLWPFYRAREKERAILYDKLKGFNDILRETNNNHDDSVGEKLSFRRSPEH